MEKRIAEEKLVATDLLVSFLETLIDLSFALLKSVVFAPLFYLFCRLTDGHAPSHDAWMGFIFAAFFYTRASKEMKQRFVSKVSENFRRASEQAVPSRIIKPGDKDFR